MESNQPVPKAQFRSWNRQLQSDYQTVASTEVAEVEQRNSNCPMYGRIDQYTRRKAMKAVEVTSSAEGEVCNSHVEAAATEQKRNNSSTEEEEHNYNFHGLRS
jgi:hypothetical protein